MVECQLPKLKVAGSNPVSRSKKIKDLAIVVKSFFYVCVAVASVFASVWRKNYPEKMCVILNISEIEVRQLAFAAIEIEQEEIIFESSFKELDNGSKSARWALFFSHLTSLNPFLHPVC